METTRRKRTAHFPSQVAWAAALLAGLALAIAPALASGDTLGVAEAQSDRPMSRPEYQPYPDRAAFGRWAVSFGAGMFTSGDLFHVALPAGVEPRYWTVPGGGQRFFSRDFRVAVDQDLLATLSVGFHLSRWWLIRFDLGWSVVPTTAYARVSQTVDLIRYDRLTFTLAGLGLEARLFATRLYPYLTAGPVLVKLTAADEPALDQTRLALRGGGGFHYSFDPSWGIRAEIRDTVRQFDMSDLAADPMFSDALFTQNGPQNLFELSLSVRGVF